MLRFCLIGFGRWGTVYFDTIKKLECCAIDSIIVNGPKVSDYDQIDAPVFGAINDVINKRQIDGFIIASPPHTHFDLAKICLFNRYPVLVEKPFADNYNQACQLIEIAKKNKTLCMVGYQHLFTKKHLALKNIIQSGVDNLVVYSESLSDGPFRKNVTVFRDWGSHELAMAIDLFNEIPLSYTIEKLSGNKKDFSKGIYLMSLTFSSSRIFNSIFGNISQVKRRTLIVTHNDGLAYSNGLDQGGLAIMKNGLIINPDSILISESKPVDLMLKKFSENIIEKVSENETFNVALVASYFLEKIESELLAENKND